MKCRASFRVAFALLGMAAIGAVPSSLAVGQEGSGAGLRSAMTFHASFDKHVDADFAKGDGRLRTAVSSDKRESAFVGPPREGNVIHEPERGKFGGAIRFQNASQPIVFYEGAKNLPMPKPHWECTVSFWLRTKPQTDLREGFCDPIQITSKQWDDAAAFVEFEKRGDRIPFRLGVYADKKVWNPNGRPFESIPAEERPLVTVNDSPFHSGDWTHVAFTLDGFNTGEPTGVSKLYLNGKLTGQLSSRVQTFTWQEEQSAIMIGLSYVGLMDDLAVFHRALTAEEIQMLVELPEGIRSLP